VTERIGAGDTIARVELEEDQWDGWFLHHKLIFDLLGPEESDRLARRMPSGNEPFTGTRRQSLLEKALANYLATHEVESLAVAHLHERVKRGQLVWVEQAFYFKGVAKASAAAEGDGRASFTGALNADPKLKVEGDFGVQWLTSSTARSELSGRRNHFILGYVRDLTEGVVTLRLIAIATRWTQPTPALPNHPVEPYRLWAGDIDQLAEVDWQVRLNRSDLNVLRGIPEKSIKERFADILGEAEVPNDWGGEQLDLWSTRLFVEGYPLMAAVAFKGPAKFHPMSIADLGKNGDQIDRLASTAADVLVVQHCHAIKPPVVNMLRAYAADATRPRRYMVIDGYDTIRILRAFDRIDR
jgi:hypothetical protein